MKYLKAFFFLLSFQAVLYAHIGGHGNEKIWIIDNQPLLAELLTYEDGKVYFLDKEYKLHTYDFEVLLPKYQELVLKENAKILQINNAPLPTHDFSFPWLLGLGIALFLLSSLLYSKQRKAFHFSYGFLGLLLVFVSACGKDDDASDVVMDLPSNDVSFMTSIFGSFSEVGTSSDATYFYVSSNGIPDHNMMVGITNWQQQVPIDHNYTGTNSWAIPIQPVLSDNPLSTETNLLKGAIAIAANGIPIFNPLNNRGEDANAIGELDQWGGHCGRADDYHYHLPPTHLQATVGSGNPIAYAVDGFPVYGETTDELDQYLGKFNDDGSYQYHTIREYPYFIAGMRGVVNLDPNTVAPENQVTPQAATQGARPALEPLVGATITDFQSTGSNSYTLTYSLNNDTYMIHYGWDDSGRYTYEFVNPDGSSTTETYQR